MNFYFRCKHISRNDLENANRKFNKIGKIGEQKLNEIKIIETFIIWEIVHLNVGWNNGLMFH